MARGDVTYSTTLPGHEHTPMLLLNDVQSLAAQLHSGAQQVAPST
jgi:hypothetical protein